MATYQAERLKENFYRIDVFHTPEFRAWSIAVSEDPKNQYAETMFLPDHFGPVDQRVEKHENVTDALKFTNTPDISSIVLKEISKKPGQKITISLN